MQRINTADGLFAEGNPATSVKGTKLTKAWADSHQEEPVNVVLAAGLELDSEDDTQLLQAIKILAGLSSGAVKTITYADSPYSVLSTDTVLRVDCTDGDVVVVFLSGAASNARKIKCKKIDTTSNAAKYTPQATEAIEGESGSYDSIMPGEVMGFYTHWC